MNLKNSFRASTTAGSGAFGWAAWAATVLTRASTAQSLCTCVLCVLCVVQVDMNKCGCAQVQLKWNLQTQLIWTEIEGNTKAVTGFENEANGFTSNYYKVTQDFSGPRTFRVGVRLHTAQKHETWFAQQSFTVSEYAALVRLEQHTCN